MGTNNLLLTKEQQVLLNLASMSISNNPQSLMLDKEWLDGVDWEKVFQGSIDHAITLATIDGAKFYKEFVPKQIYDRWIKLSANVMAANFKSLHYQNQLVEILDSNNLSYIIIKGTSACDYYPKPQHRVLGDIDFLIEKNQCEQVERILLDNGYQKSGTGHISHTVFRKQNAHLEMHYEVAGLPNNSQRQKIEEFLSSAIHLAQKKRQEICTYSAPNDLYHGLIILLHMQHHMLDCGLGLRHLCDWACYVQKTKDKEFFESQLLPFLKGIGLYKFACVMTSLCAKYLNIECPNWANSEDEKLLEQILIDILKLGDLGKKDSTMSQGGIMLAQKGEKDRGKIGNGLYRLHKAILRKHPVVKKVWIFYPFVFVWKLIKFGFLVLVGKRKSIFKMLSSAKERNEIYSKLEIFKTDDK